MSFLNKLNRPLAFLIIALMGFVWLSFALYTNILVVHALPFFEQDRPFSFYYSHDHYDINSVMLTRSPVIYDMLDKEQPGGGLAFRPNGWRDMAPEDMRVYDVAAAREETASNQIYLSTFHLQGEIWGAVANRFGLSESDFEPTVRLIGAILTALVLTLILIWFWRQLTPLSLIAGLVILPMATGIVLAAPNMFRVPWMTLLPFAVSLWTFRWHPAIHFGIIGTALLLSFLCSLEYASNTAAAIAIPAVYHGLVAGRSSMTLLGQIAKYVAIATLVFAAAMALTALRIDEFTGGEPSGLEHILARGQSWAGIHLSEERSEFGFMNGALTIAGATGLTLYGPLALPNVLVVLLGVVLVAIAFKVGDQSGGVGTSANLMSDTRAWGLTTLYALAASVSWIVLQFHHIAHHPRFAPFLILYPFILCLIGLVGLILRDLARTRFSTKNVP